MKRLTAAIVMFGIGSAAAQQRPTVPPQNAMYEALQAHFERRIGHRHQHLFDDAGSVAQWQPRQQRTRAQLEKMLWGDLRWPTAPPPARIVHTQEFGQYRIENLVIESVPGLFEIH